MNGIKRRWQRPDGAGLGPPKTHILERGQRAPVWLKIKFKLSDGAMPGPYEKLEHGFLTHLGGDQGKTSWRRSCVKGVSQWKADSGEGHTPQVEGRE